MRRVSAFLLLSLALCGIAQAEVRPSIRLRPDVAGVTVPPNICPLNFDVEGASETARVTLSNGKLERDFGKNVRVPERFWRELLQAPAYTITIHDEDKAVFCATNHVAQESIDPVLAYRLIPPSYENYKRMGLWWRDLTSFREYPLYTNLQSDTQQCVNCHSFNQGDSDTLLFHLRAENPGTLIFTGKDDPGRKRNFKVGPFFASGVYPAWHPSGRYIAFSVNDTMQTFYYANLDKVEVLDTRSDMMLYDVESDTAYPVETEPTLFDCFPSWSPDGKTLYSVAAEPGFPSIPEDKEARARQAVMGYTNFCYNLIARDFDPERRTFSQPRMIINAAKDRRSITLPRVSPDGRWLVFSLGPQGVFHVWHKRSDLWLLDLEKRTLRPLSEINSPDAESYHSFSSNGAWMVFSSRRDDGAYTRPYIAHFNTQTGTFSKPFLLPQEEPSENDRRMLSYNVPEFAKAPPSRTPRDLRHLAEQPAQDAKTPTPQPTSSGTEGVNGAR